jgi:hypothetical protein
MFAQPQLAEAALVFVRGECDWLEEHFGRHPVAALAVVAGASLLDSNLLDRFQVWFSWSGEPAHYLDLARFGSTLVLSGFLSQAREDG